MNLQRISEIGFTVGELARFREQIRQGPGCWEWTGETNRSGYGRFTIYRDGRRVRILAHRLALALTLGREPENARHTCDNPPCCRADHLVEGTQADNMQDAKQRGRANLTGLGLGAHARRRRGLTRAAAGIKRCSRCRLVKPLTEFHRRAASLDGHQGHCKACAQIRHQQRKASA